MRDSSDDVVAILASLQTRCLRRLCAVLDRPCEGLSIAARTACKQGRISGVLNRRLQQLDVAFAVVRHLSEPRARQLWDQLLDELDGGALPRAARRADGGAEAGEADVTGGGATVVATPPQVTLATEEADAESACEELSTAGSEDPAEEAHGVGGVSRTSATPLRATLMPGTYQEQARGEAQACLAREERAAQERQAREALEEQERRGKVEREAQARKARAERGVQSCGAASVPRGASQPRQSAPHREPSDGARKGHAERAAQEHVSKERDRDEACLARRETRDCEQTEREERGDEAAREAEEPTPGKAPGGEQELEELRRNAETLQAALQAELHKFFLHTLEVAGYQGVELDITQFGTEILIRTTHDRKVRGKNGSGIRALQEAVRARFGFPEDGMALFLKRVRGAGRGTAA